MEPKRQSAGFSSERAARNARRRLIEQVERGEIRHTRETFADDWNRWLARRRPYLEPGTWTDYEIHGRYRLLPAFGSRSLGDVSADDVRDFMTALAGLVEADDLAAKTANNALGTLVVCLNEAVADGLLASNPALRVHRLPPAHIERDYLRLHEIPRYLEACTAVYRPLAELLIGTGLRISEALALRVGDLELDPNRCDDRRLPLSQERLVWVDQVRPLPLGRDRSRTIRHLAPAPGRPQRARGR